MSRVAWTREDILVAYALYCITPLNKIRPTNTLIQQVAEKFPHSLSSLIMRMQNFASIDPDSKSKGLSQAAKADKEIFFEFKHNWGDLSLLAEKITGLALFDADPVNSAKPISSLTDKNKVSRERHFFRAAVFASYDTTCCISGMTLPSMLVASHIKPYAKCRSASERTDPQNGLLLNSFYDKAFDFGLITVDTTYKIHVSPTIQAQNNEFTKKWILDLEGKTIIIPKRFQPDKQYLEYHNDVIFRR